MVSVHKGVSLSLKPLSLGPCIQKGEKLIPSPVSVVLGMTYRKIPSHIFRLDEQACCESHLCFPRTPHPVSQTDSALGLEKSLPM